MKNSYRKFIKEGTMSKLASVDLMAIGKNEYMVKRVNIPKGHRGKGIGTELLGIVTNDADKECSTLLIEPYPYEDMDETKIANLIKFYEKFDFKYVSKDEYMKREPTCKRR
jgi:predicted GNAT family acetyltransferase